MFVFRDWVLLAVLEFCVDQAGLKLGSDWLCPWCVPPLPDEHEGLFIQCLERNEIVSSDFIIFPFEKGISTFAQSVFTTSL